ncbi:hypothetical protein ACX0G9_04810 [Flavitalea flava]
MKKAKSKIAYEHVVTIDPNIPDFSKSPFVIKKVENAKAFFAKHGLPNIEEIIKKSK